MGSKIINAEKFSRVLYEFTIGPTQASPPQIFVTDSTGAVLFEGDTYLPEPTVQVEIAEQTGGLEDKETVISMGFGNNLNNTAVRDFITELTAGTAHPPVNVRAIEILGDEVTYPFVGTVLKAIRHPDGKPDMVEIHVSSWKAHAKKSSGLPAMHTCVAAYGGFGCFADISSQSFDDCVLLRFPALGNGEVTISGKDASDDAAIKAMSKGFWRTGYIERNGLTIRIREWAQSSSRFVLNQNPPASWEGKTVKLRPGCPGTIDACRQRRNQSGGLSNVGNFQGIGYAIPRYNPVYEEGESS